MKKFTLFLSLFFVLLLTACDISQVRIIAQEQLSPVLTQLEDQHEGNVTYDSIEFNGIYAGLYDLHDSNDRVEEHLYLYITYEVNGESHYAIGSHYMTYDPDEPAKPHEHTIDVILIEDESTFTTEIDTYEASLDDAQSSLELIEVETPEANVDVIREQGAFDGDEINEYHFD